MKWLTLAGRVGSIELLGRHLAGTARGGHLLREFTEDLCDTGIPSVGVHLDVVSVPGCEEFFGKEDVDAAFVFAGLGHDFVLALPSTLNCQVLGGDDPNGEALALHSDGAEFDGAGGELSTDVN